MKKKFEIPELTLVLFTKEDIITVSFGLGGDDDEPGMEDPE